MKSNFAMIIDEFTVRLDEVYGMYLDSTEGLKLLRQDREQRHGRSADNGLELQYIYASPGDNFQPIQHRVEYANFIERNANLGLNYTLLAQSCIVLIYGYWEDHYRKRIADSLGLSTKNDVSIPFMNELRCLRRDIVHHGGIVTRETSQKVSFHATEGATIEFTDGEFFLLILTIKKSLEDFKQLFTNPM